MSYLFDGVDDILTDGTNGGADLNISTYTIMTWFKTGTLPSSTGHVMGRTSSTHVADNHMMFRAVADGTQVGQHIHRQAADGSGTNGGVATMDALHHSIGLTDWDCIISSFDYDGARVPRWNATINGAGSFTYANTAAPIFGEGSHFTLGKVWNSGARNFQGNLAHVAIWNRVLTAQEITDLNAGGLPSAVAPSGLLRYWPLTAENVTQVDLAGSGHSLTVTGATFSTDDPPVSAENPTAVLFGNATLTAAGSSSNDEGQAFHDFSNVPATESLTAHGWTSIWHTGFDAIAKDSAEAEYGGRVIELSSSSASRQALLAPDSPAGENQFDVVARVKTVTGSSSFGYRHMMRMSGTDTSETGIFACLYASANLIHSVKYINAAAHTAVSVGESQNHTQWVYFRSRIGGDGVMRASYDTDLAQVYDASDPTAAPVKGWTFFYDASNVPAGGWGLQSQQTDYVAELDWIGVGWGGAGAPVAPTSTYLAKKAELGAVLSLWDVDGSTWTDESGNNHHGTIVGATAVPPPPGTTIPAALKGDGIDDYIRVAHHADFEAAAFSLELWVQRGSAAAESWKAWFGKGNDTWQMRRHENVDGSVRLDVLSDTVRSQVVTTGDPLAADTWYHVVVTADGLAAGELALYIDGTLHATAGGTGPPDTDSLSDVTFMVQDNAGVLRRFNDLTVAAASYYPTALTAAQVGELYDATFESYRYVRWTITKRKSDVGSFIQVSRFHVRSDGTEVAWPAGTTVYSPRTYAEWADQEPFRMIDGLTSTKWLDRDFEEQEDSSPVTFDVGEGNELTFDAYSYWTANDDDFRDPVSWTVEVSNNNEDWTLIDTRTDETITTTREVLAGTWSVTFPESGAPVLSLIAKTNTSIEFSWTDSETWDGYEVLRHGVLINTTTLKTYEDTGLSPTTEYSYEVRGYKTT